MHLDSSNLDGTGYERVDTEVFCVMTRFRVRSVWSLIRFYILFKRVQRQLARVRGLLSAQFLVEDWRTCYTVSLWQDARAILHFNTAVHAHIDAANLSFRHVHRDASGPHIWSAQFRLFALSPDNLRWKGMSIDAAFRDSAMTRNGRVRQPTADDVAVPSAH